MVGFAFSTIFPMKRSARDLLVYYSENPDIPHPEGKEKKLADTATYRTEIRIMES